MSGSAVGTTAATDGTAARTDDGALPFVEIRGLHKRFGANRVLRGVDLVVPRGSVFTILGGSGSGKSVLLKHLVGLLRPDAGRVVVDGVDATAFGEAEWIPVRRRIGYVFQGAALFDSLDVYENLAYPLREHEDWPEERIARRVAQCLEAVGLAGVERRMPAALSGGMRKRVGVARAIALEPSAILYDEPTTGLDPGNSRRIGRLIRSLQQRLHATSVVVTHDLELCKTISDRVALLRHGVVCEEGSIEELRAGALPAVAEFLDGEGEDDAAAAHAEAGDDGPGDDGPGDESRKEAERGR